jgi:hypothetical protein
VAVVALAGGIIGGLVFGMVSWFFIFISIAAGQIMAGAILPAAGRRPGLALALVSVVFIIIGVLASTPLQAVLEAVRDPAQYGPVREAFQVGVRSGLLDIYGWVGAAIMAGSAFTRLR